MGEVVTGRFFDPAIAYLRGVYTWGCQETLCCKPRTLLFEGTGVPLGPRGCADGFLRVCRGAWTSVDTNTHGITLYGFPWIPMEIQDVYEDPSISVDIHGCYAMYGCPCTRISTEIHGSP